MPGEVKLNKKFSTSSSTYPNVETFSAKLQHYFQQSKYWVQFLELAQQANKMRISSYENIQGGLTRSEFKLNLLVMLQIVPRYPLLIESIFAN